MAGGDCGDVLAQYTTLTGRSPMPPKYVFGFHQGAYGYFDHVALSTAANAYRAARIPIDGLHIDIDFQDNYRNFTHSETKFPDARRYLDGLHASGFKCSTDVTALMTANILDETGNVAAYLPLNVVRAADALLESRFADESANPGLPRRSASPSITARTSARTLTRTRPSSPTPTGVPRWGPTGGTPISPAPAPAGSGATSTGT